MTRAERAERLTRFLVVGDVHAKVEDLEDCRHLIDLVVEVAAEHKPDFVLFLGDQYDTHALKHLEVERFWMESFRRLKLEGPRVIALVGNHDRPGNAASSATALQAHGDILVVSEPYLFAPFLFLPYYHDKQELVKAAADYPDTKVVFCHQTFDGSKYDNGYFAKEALDQALLPQPSIISGHIHMPMTFGKVRYIGSPRWQTISDANISRAIHLLDFDHDGTLLADQAFETDGRLRKIWQLVYTPDDRCEKEFAAAKPGDLVVVNIQGPLAFCEESKRKLAGPGVRPRLFPTDRQKSKLSEAEGVPAAFQKHVESYKPKYGTPKDTLRRLLQERLHV